MLRHLAMLLAATLALGAHADLPPDPDALAIVHEDADGRRTPLLDPRRLPMHDDLGHGLEPEITVERSDDLGYDLIFDFENTTSEPRGLGRIEIGIITPGREFSWLNLNRHCGFVDTDRRSFSGQVRSYPGSFYSPVGVIRNDKFAVGVSLLYDILQDRHDVTVRILKKGGAFTSGPGGPGMSIGFDLSNDAGGNGRVGRPGSLLPGESRRYRVAVRAVQLDGPGTTDGPQQWLECIEPYRSHFEALYGGVTYQRDPRPTRPKAVSGGHELSPSNPMGFMYGSAARPDLVGWGPLVTRLMQTKGYERTMLWTPGGMHINNRNHNYPSRFMSQLTTTEELATAFDEQIGLPRLVRTGHSVGLWWGRAAQVSAAWDSPNSQPLDLRNPAAVDLAQREFSLAVDTGATTIGLDAFTTRHMPVWQQYEWILGLRRSQPTMRFIIEPTTCDVMHTLGGTFERAWRGTDSTRDEERFLTDGPHYLADYLVPGHETWGYFRYDHQRVAKTMSRVQRDAERLARFGYVPVMAAGVRLSDAQAASADPTWLRTVPDRLKTPAHATATPPVLDILGTGDTGGNGGDDSDSGDTGGSGDTRGDGGSPDKFAPPETRPFMLPNGRIIMLPVYNEN